LPRTIPRAKPGRRFASGPVKRIQHTKANVILLTGQGTFKAQAVEAALVTIHPDHVETHEEVKVIL
jgi:hypothetical protein